MENVPHEVAVRIRENIRYVLKRFEEEFDVERASFVDQHLVDDNTVDVTVMYYIPDTESKIWPGDYETCDGYMWYDKEENEWHLSAAPEWATY